MPLLFLLELFAQGYCVYHAAQRGSVVPWIYVIMIPGLGPSVYFLIEILPDLIGTRRGRQVTSTLRDVINPDRDYRTRKDELETSGSPAARAAYADDCAKRGQFDEAVSLYRQALEGFYADDPALLLGFARVLLDKGEFAECQRTLDHLREENPQYKSTDGHLIYARALEGQEKVSDALHEYEALSNYYPGLEAKVRHALYLQKLGRAAEAQTMLQGILANFKRAPRHAQELNREWASVARRSLEA